MHTYLFAYSLPNGFGNTTVRTRMPSTHDDVMDIERAIEAKHGGGKVLIISITPLRKWWEFWK